MAIKTKFEIQLLKAKKVTNQRPGSSAIQTIAKKKAIKMI